jgi:hypothetical protein
MRRQARARDAPQIGVQRLEQLVQRLPIACARALQQQRERSRIRVQSVHF